MKNLSYPAQYSVLAPDEMVYIDGGTTVDTIRDGLMLAAMVGGAAVLGMAAIGTVISVQSEKALRTEYEKTYGISAVDSSGLYTTDFLSYKTRAENQGRNQGAELSAKAFKVLITPLSAVMAVGLLVAIIGVQLDQK